LETGQLPVLAYLFFFFLLKTKEATCREKERKKGESKEGKKGRKKEKRKEGRKQGKRARQ